MPVANAQRTIDERFVNDELLASGQLMSFHHRGLVTSSGDRQTTTSCLDLNLKNRTQHGAANQHQFLAIQNAERITEMKSITRAIWGYATCGKFWLLRALSFLSIALMLISGSGAPEYAQVVATPDLPRTTQTPGGAMPTQPPATITPIQTSTRYTADELMAKIHKISALDKDKPTRSSALPTSATPSPTLPTRAEPTKPLPYSTLSQKPAQSAVSF